MSRKVKCLVVTQMNDGTDYSQRLNAKLEKIQEGRNISNLILFPAISTDGKLATLIQWSYETDKPTDVMIQGLATDVYNIVRLGNSVNHAETIKAIADKLEDFYNI